ncbi:hypothetical protein BD410DRAFT_897917 [Rickenella mellea]|uniref:Mixed lineage kinase domain-containing protein n=1 Tax=Rickenella mellea TaxID=50990 RepID=A0A4Y7Q7A8_9AGAM|nr:hypothetical protein BD410DRAFT_897917 [Rickenella mellea]
MASLRCVTRLPEVLITTNHTLKTGSKKSRSTIDDSLSNASSFVEMAKAVAPLAPVPFLLGIIGTAQSIIDTAHGVRQNKSDCAELARRVSDLTEHIHGQIRGHEDIIDTTLAVTLEGFQQQLVEIEQFMLDHTSQQLISRIVHRGSVSVRIVKLTSKLNNAMQAFTTTLNLRLALQMNQLSRSMEGFKDIVAGNRQYDGQFHIYRRADVCLIAKRTLQQFCDGSSEEYHDGIIDGRTVAVKIYRNSPKRFTAALNALKHVWHPNVAQLEGYSQNDCYSFLVLKIVIFPLREYLSSLTQLEQMLTILKSIAIYIDVELYLRDRGLTSMNPSTEFKVDARCEPHFEALNHSYYMPCPGIHSRSCMVDLTVQQLPACAVFSSDYDLVSWSRPFLEEEDLHVKNTSVALHQGVSRLSRNAINPEEFQGLLHAFVDSFSHLISRYRPPNFLTGPDPRVVRILDGKGPVLLSERIMKDKRREAMAYLATHGPALAVHHKIKLEDIAITIMFKFEYGPEQASEFGTESLRWSEKTRLTPGLAHLLRLIYSLQYGFEISECPY